MSPKKILSYLTLLFFVFGWYFLAHTHPQQTNVHVLGANTNLTLYEEPDAGHQPILDAIHAAQKEILVEVYLLSDKQIIQALVDATSRGVDVKVMMEQHPFGSGSLNEKSKEQLDASGISTEWSNPTFTLTHEKSITIDGSETFILSQNLTASAFTKNREHDVLDTNPQDVTEVRTIFYDDWEKKPFSPPQNTSIIESPDTSRTVLVALVTGATKSLDAETEDIDDDQLISAFCDRAKIITVRLLTPTLSQLSSNKNSLTKLSSCGVEVKTISSPYMHAKMLVSDNTKAYIGSINFSTQSMDQNRELGIILTVPDDIETLENTFEKDWDNATTY